MTLRALVKTKIRPVVVPAVSAVLVVYFAYHLVQGDRGLIALNRLEGEVVEAEAALETLRSRRAALEAKVDQLSPPAIDRDLLVERARIVLNFTHPDDVVLFLPDEAAVSGR